MDADFLREFAKNCIAAEREACAQLVESTRRSDVEDTALRAIAASIRARTVIPTEAAVVADESGKP